MQQLLGDLVERLELTLWEQAEPVEQLRLCTLPHRILEQRRLVGGEVDTVQERLQLGDGGGVHRNRIPTPAAWKRRLPRARPGVS